MSVTAHVRVDLAGEVDATSTPDLADHFRRYIGQAKANGLRGVSVDLSRVTFTDSSAIGTFVAARRSAQDQGLMFVLCDPSPFVRRVLELTGLTLLTEES